MGQINYSTKAVQIVPDGSPAGSVLKTTIASTAETLETIAVKYEPIDLSELTVSGVTEASRARLRSALQLDADNSIFTIVTDADVVAKNGSQFVIDGAGAIELWAAEAGESCLILDPLRRLIKQSNLLKATTGYTIADGQLVSGVAAADTFDLSAEDSGFHGGAIVLVCDGKNWLIDFVNIKLSTSPIVDAMLTWVGVEPNFISTLDDLIYVNLKVV